MSVCRKANYAHRVGAGAQVYMLLEELHTGTDNRAEVGD